MAKLTSDKAEPVNKATPPSLTAQDLAREYIEEHYGYGPPQETVEDLALAIERFAADSVSACVDAQNVIDQAIREEIVGIIFRACQPNNGALFSQIDDEIRALLAVAETIGNECSFCRRRHGEEVQHAAE